MLVVLLEIYIILNNYNFIENEVCFRSFIFYGGFILGVK